MAARACDWEGMWLGGHVVGRVWLGGHVVVKMWLGGHVVGRACG